MIFIITLFVRSSFASPNQNINKGKKIVIQSGCIKCHSFIKGKQIKGYDTLAGFGDRHLTIKQTEKAIRSCRMDPYCSQILTDKQVKYVAYYLNSLKNKGGFYAGKKISKAVSK
ncbi:MAG: c-type cytochrome [bacterium]